MLYATDNSLEWTTPAQSVEDAIRWLERLGSPDEYQIVRILVDGVMHCRDEQWLLGLHRCANPMRDASAYWRGSRGAPRPRVEVIFEERARVEEVFSHLWRRARSGSIR